MGARTAFRGVGWEGGVAVKQREGRKPGRQGRGEERKGRGARRTTPGPEVPAPWRRERSCHGGRLAGGASTGPCGGEQAREGFSRFQVTPSILPPPRSRLAFPKAPTSSHRVLKA